MQIFHLTDTQIDHRLEKGIAFAQELMARKTLEGGRHDMDESDIFGVVIDYDTPIDNELFEAHRKIIDLHVMVSGNETIEYCHCDGLDVQTGYQEADDYILFHAPKDGRVVQSVVLYEGAAMAFYPEDAHRPGLAHDTPQSIRKIVVKIPL